MRFVDLSAPIEQSPPDLPELLRTDITFLGHEEGAQSIETMLGVPRRLLRDGEGLGVEEFTRFGTPTRPMWTRPGTTTHDRRRARADDRRAAAGVVPRPGRRARHDRKADGDPMTAAEAEAALEAAGHDLQPYDIVLVRTGRDEFYREPDYIVRGPGVTVEATRWLFERGVRVMGIDAWGWDAPLHMQAQEALERDEPGIFWEAHQADLPYSQIERLFNLGRAPPTGFTVSCSPAAGGAAGRAGAGRGMLDS